jgi:hypothetical protein
MSLVVVLLLLLAGLSEAVGRILPLIARRPGVSRTFVVGLLATGALVDSAVFALWPLGTWALAVLMLPALAQDGTGLMWTPGLLAPLVFAAILEFPLRIPAPPAALCGGRGRSSQFANSRDGPRLGGCGRLCGCWPPSSFR